MTEENDVPIQSQTKMESWRLDHGYTELSVTVYAGTPFPMPIICSACGQPVEEKTAGDARVFTVSSMSLSMDTVSFSLDLDVYLCSACAATGTRIEWYVQVDLVVETLVLQIGNDEAVDIWRACLTKYENMMHRFLEEHLRRELKKPNFRKARVSLVKPEKRFSPEMPNWKPPLANIPIAVPKNSRTQALLITVVIAAILLVLLLIVLVVRAK